MSICLAFPFSPLGISFSEEDWTIETNLHHSNIDHHSNRITPTTLYEWSYVNFTWNNLEQYTEAINTKRYVPQNLLIGGIRFFKNDMYMSLPKYRPGVPATLTVVPKAESKSTNVLMTPFPSWEENDDSDCDNLQNVLGIEIDTQGTLWVLDGVRVNNMSIDCPAKLLLFDLNQNGALIHTYTFPNEICLQNGGFLNDLVVDETDGGLAYITDNSNIDPGLIVYSRLQNKSWKFRDGTMFADLRTSRFVVDTAVISTPLPIDGIALSPSSLGHRKVFFSTVGGLDLYSISTDILKNESSISNGLWRYGVSLLGTKQGHTDGMMIDADNTLYYTLIDLYGIGKWNVEDVFDSSEVIYRNRTTVIWADSIAMDQQGCLYFTASSAHRYLFPTTELQLTSTISFRIFRMYTGTKSYLF
ncbi:protein yellow-like [Diabrotica undecimpunctata]|uniref:protein yellow-like n=1 Tax=Diabrotica undecimpunctata TaxID=50387 RepID=UPI003B641D53